MKKSTYDPALCKVHQMLLNVRAEDNSKIFVPITSFLCHQRSSRVQTQAQRTPWHTKVSVPLIFPNTSTYVMNLAYMIFPSFTYIYSYLCVGVTHLSTLFKYAAFTDSDIRILHNNLWTLCNKKPGKTVVTFRFGGIFNIQANIYLRTISIYKVVKILWSNIYHKGERSYQILHIYTLCLERIFIQYRNTSTDFVSLKHHIYKFDSTYIFCSNCLLYMVQQCYERKNRSAQLMFLSFWSSSRGRKNYYLLI